MHLFLTVVCLFQNDVNGATFYFGLKGNLINPEDFV